jgi:hypothetical protein
VTRQLTGRTARAFGDNPQLSTLSRKDRDDPIGLTQVTPTQDNSTYPIEPRAAFERLIILLFASRIASVHRYLACPAGPGCQMACHCQVLYTPLSVPKARAS